MYVYFEPLDRELRSTLAWPLSSTKSNGGAQKVKWDQIVIPHLLIFHFQFTDPGFPTLETEEEHRLI